MFNKKDCKRCGEKISKKYSFCPKCGTPINQKQNNENWGMLGKNDFSEEVDPFSNSFLGKISGGIINKMLNNTMKMLEKEMQKEMQNKNQDSRNMPRTKFRLMINGKEINLNNGELAENQQKENIKENKIKLNEFTEEQILRLSKLKKTEPKTYLKRIGDKIIYEVELPGVESQKDISIRKLENSIEIKAIAKNIGYIKRIQLGLLIINYNFSNNLLILEFKGN